MLRLRARCPSLAMAMGLALALGGCTLLDIRDQSRAVEQLAQFDGHVDVRLDDGARVYAALLHVEAGTVRWVNRFRIGRSGRFHFPAPPGDYAVAAFADENDDGAYQFEEPAGYAADNAGEPEIFTVAPGEEITVTPFTVRGPLDNVSHYDIVPDLSKATQNIGARASLNDAIFERTYTSMGMWRPFDFAASVGGGLFLLQDYAPDKTPVIFVHGINGGPRDFAETIAALDTSRFQPWAFYYPSGVRLAQVSEFLVKAVNQLQAQHGFEHFFVVAHSMGGLMARSFVKRHYETGSPAHLAFFMTINSPIGGLKSAREGVDRSPVVLPAWRDLATGSEFIRELEQWPWPERTPYHLVFSYESGEGDDGLVALESQIPSYLQKQAARVYGYNAGHAGILREPEFHTDLNAVLHASLEAL
ncbi:MAG: alpha/beta fold hydrolase [Pseudomonadota bacterium]